MLVFYNRVFMSVERHAGLVELECLGSIANAGSNYLMTLTDSPYALDVLSGIIEVSRQYVVLGNKLS